MKGRRLQADFVSIIEAVYAIDQPAEAWLKHIMSAAAPALDEGVGVGGMLYEIADHPPYTLNLITGIGLPAGWLEARAQLHATPELHQDIKRGYENILCGGLMEFARLADNFQIVQDCYKRWNIAGGLILNGCDTSRKGVCLHLYSHKPFRVTRARWKLLKQLSTHLATGYRLHRRLSAADFNAPIEAVLTARARIEHVESAAKDDAARASLMEAVQRRQWSRGRARFDEPERAVAVSRGLVAGRWTLVDRYESDGKRYIVARQDTHGGHDKPALSKRESEVVSLAALGRSNKMISYELDLAHATVRVLISRAARKLGARSRPELVSRFCQRADSGGS